MQKSKLFFEFSSISINKVKEFKLKPEAILCSIVINLGLALGITNQVTPLSLFLIIVNLGHAPPCFLVWLYIFLHYRYHFLPMMSAKRVKIIWMRIQFVLAMLQKTLCNIFTTYLNFPKTCSCVFVRYFVRYIGMISR